MLHNLIRSIQASEDLIHIPTPNVLDITIDSECMNALSPREMEDKRGRSIQFTISHNDTLDDKRSPIEVT